MADISSPAGATDVPVDSTEGYSQTDFAEAMLQDGIKPYTQEDFMEAMQDMALPEVSVELPSTEFEPLQVTVGGPDVQPEQPQEAPQPEVAPQEPENPWANMKAPEATYATQEEAIAADPAFVAAARKLRERFKDNWETGIPPEDASDAQMAEWAIGRMGQFNWNLTQTATDAFNLKDWSKEDIEAFVYIMDEYEKLPNFTWSGTGRAAKGIVTDPTSYLGIGLLARLFGVVGKEAGKGVVRELLKKGVSEQTANRLIQAGKILGTAAIEGGLYSGSDDLLRQSIEINADRQDELDWGRALVSSAYGVAAGPAIVVTGYGAYRGGKAVIDAMTKSKVADDVVEETLETVARANDNPNADLPVLDNPPNPEVVPLKDPDEVLDVQRKFDDQLDEVNDGLNSDVLPNNKPNADGRVVRDGGDGTVVIEDGNQRIPNLTRLETTDDVKKLVFERAQATLKDLLNLDNYKGGKQSLKSAQQAAKKAAIQLAEQSGRSTESAVKFYEKFTKGEQSDFKALQEIQARALAISEIMTETAERLAKMAKSKKPEDFTNSEKAEFLQLKETLDALSVMDGMYSKQFSRNLGSRRVTRGTWEILDTLNKADEAAESGVEGMVNRVRASKQAIDDEFAQLHQAVKSSRGNLKMLRERTKPGVYTKMLQKIVSFRTEAMISGLSTQQAALFGNLINIIKYPLLKKIAGRFRGGEAGARMRMEASVLLTGYRMFANEARRLAVQAYKQGGGITDPAKSQLKTEGFDSHASSPSFIKKLLKLTLPGDLMSGFDEFTKALFTRSEAYSKAYIRILEADPNIKPKEAKKQAEAYVRRLIDPATGQFKDADLIQTARELSYMQDVNDTVIGRTVSTLANAGGGIGRLFAMPFVKAPLNIISEGLMFVPGTSRITERQARIVNNFKAAKQQLDELDAGALDVTKEEADLIRRTWEQAAEEKAFLNARKTIGYGLVVTTSGLAANGLITGNGPSEEGARKIWLKSHQPLSIKVGDKWVSYKALEPFATVMALSADLTHTVMRLSEEDNNGETVEVVKEMMAALQKIAADTFLEKSMVMGMDTFLEALQDPKKAETFFNSFASSFVPNFLKDIKPDDYKRESTTALNAMAKKVPLLDEMVGKRYDDFGRPVKSEDWLLNTLPVSKVRDEADRVTEALYQLRDKYDREGSLNAMSVNLGISTKGTDFRKVMDNNSYGLGESVYSKFHKILGEVTLGGKTLYESIEEIVDSPRFEALSVGNKSQSPLILKQISKVFSTYRKAALRELYKVSPKYREAKDNEFAEKTEVRSQAIQNLRSIGY
jgi:hypothetical protein